MPYRVSEIEAVLARYGVLLDSKAGKGSHMMFRRAGFPSYTVPAHNGRRTEVTDLYIRRMARQLGLDPDDVFRALRGG